ncbi:MAG: type III-A CRISPR-associated RAMP protein Csm4 [Dethiobacter sp.]
MGMMKLYKVTYKLRSATASSWHADTIFGHLCWALRYHEGEDSLKDFLQEYEEGRPPLIVSNGFPLDYLPRPIMTPLPFKPADKIERQFEDFKQRKMAGKGEYLTLEEFNRALNGEPVLPKEENILKRKEQISSPRTTLKNQINRLTATTGGEGQLFDFEEYFWPRVSIYARIADEFIDQARKLFETIAPTGFGKRKSVGYGAIESMEFDEFDGFKTPSNANGFVTLSNFVPAGNDPVKGAWQTIVKYGKLGEEYANRGNPFKRPLLMLTAGSTFYDAPCKEYYGRMIHKVSSYPEVVQYALALPIVAKLPEGE